MPREGGIDDGLVERIARLPHLAQVAFAWRCARRVYPLLDVDPHWKVDEPTMLKLGATLDGVGRFCAGGTPLPHDLVEVTLRICDALIKGFERSRSQRRHAATYTVLALQSAIRATFDKAEICAADAAMEAISAGKMIAKGRGSKQVERAQTLDLALLLNASVGWDNHTPVHPHFFGPLWRDGEPERWPWVEDTSEGKELVVSLDIPEGMTDKEILDIIGEVALKADKLNRAYGGHGLMVEEGNIVIERPVNSPVGGRS